MKTSITITLWIIWILVAGCFAYMYYQSYKTKKNEREVGESEE